jgi:protein subunit release factor A
MSAPESNDHEFNPQQFEAAITDLEIGLENLKTRYHQVTQDEQRKEELQAREQELKVQLKDNSDRDPIKSELHYIEKELEELELRLESKLLNWNEPFWQAVRFGGMGIIIGWILHSCANS